MLLVSCTKVAHVGCNKLLLDDDAESALSKLYILLTVTSH
jgi:hypothetical protein